MTKLVLAIAVLLLVAFAIAVVKATARNVVGTWPYQAKRVLSQPEQVLYWRLVEALPEQVILAQVQLSRFLAIKKGNRRTHWLNRVSQKSADFVVCSRDFAVLAVIELDDASHSKAARKKADEDKDKAIGDAGLSVLRWQVKQLPSLEEIRSAVLQAPSLIADYATGGVGGKPPTENALSALGTPPRRWR